MGAGLAGHGAAPAPRGIAVRDRKRVQFSTRGVGGEESLAAQPPRNSGAAGTPAALSLLLGCRGRAVAPRGGDPAPPLQSGTWLQPAPSKRSRLQNGQKEIERSEGDEPRR